MDVNSEAITRLLADRRTPQRRHVSALGCDVAVRLLSDEDIDFCKLEAQRYCQKVRADLSIDPEFLERERMRQIIWRSFLDADDETRKFFPADDDVRKLDAVMVQMLFTVYLDVNEAMDMTIRLTDEQVEQVLEALGKEQGAQDVLMHFEPDTLRACVRSMASRLRAT